MSLDPFLLCKYVLRCFLKKKIHPPHLLIFQENSSLHGYSNLHVYWFCNFCTPSTFIPTSMLIREMRVSLFCTKEIVSVSPETATARFVMCFLSLICSDIEYTYLCNRIYALHNKFHFHWIRSCIIFFLHLNFSTTKTAKNCKPCLWIWY